MAFLTDQQFLALKSWVEDKISLHHDMKKSEDDETALVRPSFVYWRDKNEQLDEEVRKAMCGE